MHHIMPFSSIEVSGLFFSPLIGKNLNYVGRKNTILIGEVIMVINKLFISLDYLDHYDGTHIVYTR